VPTRRQQHANWGPYRIRKNFTSNCRGHDRFFGGSLARDRAVVWAERDANAARSDFRNVAFACLRVLTHERDAKSIRLETSARVNKPVLIRLRPGFVYRAGNRRERNTITF